MIDDRISQITSAGGGATSASNPTLTLPTIADISIGTRLVILCHYVTVGLVTLTFLLVLPALLLLSTLASIAARLFPLLFLKPSSTTTRRRSIQ
jgi:hypothetical protein